jgi:arabinofuranosyltransferase
MDLARQSLLYFLDSLKRDPITLLVIFVVAAVVIRKGEIRERIFAAGVILYLVYIVKIGGDFMSGRFFSAALVASVLLAMRWFEPMTHSWRYAIAILAILLGFLAPYPSLLPHTEKQPLFTEADLVTGIQDERGYYYHLTGLLTVFKNGWALPNAQGWVARGLTLRASDRSVALEKNIGFVGYYAGPAVFLVDVYALSDPLLSRLPIPNPHQWRIGHFEREVPGGYLATLRTGQNKLTDPGLAAYYDKLSLIIRGPLWSSQRLRAIWDINTGQYNFWLKGAQ